MKFKTSLEILLFCILGLIPRLILLNYNQAGIESDEAIVGLMAKHILDGSPIPIFYYGQSYMGSLEALLTSISFSLFGISNLSLKLIPLIFSIFLIAINYHFGYQLRGIQCARISGLLTAIAPSPLIVWSLKARGGFIETVVIGSLCLFLSIKLCTSTYKQETKIYLHIFILGLLAGLGWWTNNQIIFYYPSIAFGIIVMMISVTFITKIKVIAYGLISFIIGSLPFWYYNLTSKPKWATFEVLFGKTAGSNKLEYFENYWSTALPIILGARKFWSTTEVFQEATYFIYLIYGLILIFPLFKNNRTPHDYFNKNDNKSIKLTYYTLIVFLITVPLIFSLSSFGWLSQAPRYLLPLYSVLPIFCGLTLTSYETISRGKKLLSTFLILSIIIINLFSNYLGGIADEGQPMLYKGQRVSKDHSELYSWLKENNFKHIHTNYWIGYRLAFESMEDITFTVFSDPKTSRIKKYHEIGNSPPYNELKNRVYVLAYHEAKAVIDWLNVAGYKAKTHNASNYVILYSIESKYSDGIKLELNKDQFRSFIPPNNTDLRPSAFAFNNLIDNNLSTRWGSGKAQTLGMAIEIDFPTPTTIQRIVIKSGNFELDTARFLNISGFLSSTGKRIEIINPEEARLYTSRQGLEITELFGIRFEPKTLSKLRLELIEDAPFFDWSIAEIEIFGPIN